MLLFNGQIGGFGSFTMGLLNAWPTYASEIFRSNVTTPMSAPMTLGEEALLSSLPSLGGMVGVAITGFLINSFGRRNGGVLLSLLILLSWAIISITNSLTLVLVARFLAGISGGAAIMLTPIFISEVAEDAIRGTLASAPMFLYCTGVLVAYVMGWTLPYKTTVWINLVACSVSTILLILVTESPVYFLRRNREEDAKLSIAKFRGVPVSSKVVLEELNRLKQLVTPSVQLVSMKDAEATKPEEVENEKLQLEDNTPMRQQNISTIKLLFTEPASRRAFLVLSSLMTFQVFMGNVPVQVYAKTVFTEADSSKADLYTILYAVVLFSGSAISTMITDRAGRRILLITSSALVFVLLISLGYLLQSKVAPPSINVIFIFAYCFSFIFGAGTIPYVLLAEIFIPEVQNLASTIVIELMWLLNFLILGIFPYMNSAFGIHGSFYIFACLGLVNATFAYFNVPETKGLSNTQIQTAFLLRKRN